MRRKTCDGREITFVTLNTQTDWDWVSSSEKIGARHIVGSPRSSIIKKKPPSRETPKPESVGPSKVAKDETSVSASPQTLLPYNDEFGIPILDLSTDTDDKKTRVTGKRGWEVLKKKMMLLNKTHTRTTPGFGWFEKMQTFQRKSQKKSVSAKDPDSRLPPIRDADNFDIDNDGKPHGMYSGICEFCEKMVKPFPTLEQHLQISPEKLYCCHDYREFVEFVLSTTTELEKEEGKKTNMINIKPHDHVFSEEERNATKEKTIQRMRERELQRRAQEETGIQQNFFASHISGSSFSDPIAAGHGPESMKDLFEPGQLSGTLGQTTIVCLQTCPVAIAKSPDSVTKGSLDMVWDGGPVKHSKACIDHRMSQLTSAFVNLFKKTTTAKEEMDTINYQLSSQKCLEEGWTLRALSPILDDDGIEVFIPEPLNAAHISQGRLRERPLIEKFYETVQKFLTMFPDGTGNVFYPSGNLAILITSVKFGHYCYTIHQDVPRSAVVASFGPTGYGYCYFPNGDVRLYMDQFGGIELDQNGGQKHKWSWKDQITHVHAPPFQPICIGLNRSMGLRVMSQENITITFNSFCRSCRFNMGCKLKLVAPENAPIKKIEEERIFLEEKKSYIESLLDKIATLLKLPNSLKINKILPPLHQGTAPVTPRYCPRYTKILPPLHQDTAPVTRDVETPENRDIDCPTIRE